MTYPPVAIRDDFDDNTAAVTVHAEHHNDLADGINDVTVELGPNPKGTFENVDERLTDIETTTDNALTTVLFADAGEIIVSDGPQSAQALGPGAQYEILTIDAGVPVWADWISGAGTSAPALVELATAAETETGTDTTRAIGVVAGQATYIKKSLLTTAGDIIYATGASTPARLALGTSGYVLKAGASAPSWVKPSATLYVDSADRASTSTGGTEDDLSTYTIPAGQLAANGDRIDAVVCGTWVGHATATRRLRIYFAGTAVADSSAYATTYNGTYSLNVSVVRVSSSVVRVSVNGGLPAYSAIGPLSFAGQNYTEITGLTLANTQIIKTTGVAAGAGAAASDIVNKIMTVDYVPAP